VNRLSTAGAIRGTAAIGALAAFPFVFPEHWVLNIAVFTLMYAALATSWNLIGGYTGYVSLGHVAFFGVGAYTVAILFTKHMSVGSGYRPFYVLPLVGLGVGLASVPIGWIAFRTRAATFAIVTLTLIFVAQQLAFNLHSLTNGSTGILLPLAPFPNSTFERPFYYAMLGLLVLALAICWWARGSKLGLALFAIRDDEDRARGLGQRVTMAKLIAFSLSAGLTAMVGAVWAYYLGQIYPQFAFDPLITIGMVLMVYLGGKGTLWGPVVGALVLVPAQQYLAYRLGGSELYLIGYAAVFLIVMLLMPRGILPSLAEQMRRRRNPRTGRPATPSRQAEELATP
jgi:branched-chain amino acid transport system permease protein